MVTQKNKQTARTRQPKPSVATNQEATGTLVNPSDTAEAGTSGEMTAVGTLSEQASNVLAMPGGKRKSIFDVQRDTVTQQAAEKMAVMGTVRQRLAEAASLYKQGDDKAAEAKEIADNASVKLYQARTHGLLSGEEVSGVLGDIFGFKQKKDGSPSKTPEGQGEAIRKRIVRAVAAAEYVANGDGGTFFKDVPTEPVSDILDRLAEGQITIWSAYDYFAEVKREHMVKTNAAFDPKRIAGIVEALSEEGAAEIFRSNTALVASYAALQDVLRIVGEQAAALPEPVAEAA